MKDFVQKAFSGLISKIGLISFAFLFFSFAFASQANAAIVISEVYGGGGNSGANLQNDFVELYNNGSTAVDVSGYSIQYAPATGTTGTYQVVPLSTATDTVIEPGTYFLIQLASGTTTGLTALPKPNVASTTINIATGAGKVALVNGIAPLSQTTCPVTDTSVTTLIDYVGFGTTANCSENANAGTANAPVPTNTQSITRNATGTDTNDNSDDFTVTAINGQTPTAGGNGDLTITQSAPASVTTGSNFDYTLTVNNSGSNTNLTGVSVNFTIPTGVTLYTTQPTVPCTSSTVVAGVIQFRGCTITANTTNITITVTAPATAQTITSTGANVVVDPTATIPETNETNNTAADVSTTVTLGSTAALVNVSGHASNFKGRPIAGALVTLTDGNGNKHSAYTDDFGNYLFEGVEVGQILVFEARAKRYIFTQPMQVISLNGENVTVNFVGYEEKRFF